MCNSFGETVNNLSDAELICRIRENDDEAFAVLFGRYAPTVRQIVARYANGTHDHEDLMQEATISFYYAAMFFDFQSSSFATFSSVCVERGVITAVKKASAKKRVPADMIVPLEDNMESAQDDPEKLLIDKEEHSILSGEIVGKLSPFERKVLISFLSTGSYDRTAAELSVPKKSVDNALSRLRKKLDSLK